MTLGRVEKHYQVCLSSDASGRKDTAVATLLQSNVRPTAVQGLLACCIKTARSASASREHLDPVYRRRGTDGILKGDIRFYWLCGGPGEVAQRARGNGAIGPGAAWDPLGGAEGAPSPWGAAQNRRQAPPNWCPSCPTFGTLCGCPFTTRAGRSTPSLLRAAKWHEGWTLPTRWRCKCASWEGRCPDRKPWEASCCDTPRATRLQPTAPWKGAVAQIACGNGSGPSFAAGTVPMRSHDAPSTSPLAAPNGALVHIAAKATHNTCVEDARTPRCMCNALHARMGSLRRARRTPRKASRPLARRLMRGTPGRMTRKRTARTRRSQIAMKRKKTRKRRTLEGA